MWRYMSRIALVTRSLHVHYNRANSGAIAVVANELGHRRRRRRRRRAYTCTAPTPARAYSFKYEIWFLITAFSSTERFTHKHTHTTA